MGSSSGPIIWTMNGCEVEETAGSKQELPINDQLVRKDNSQPATASSTSREQDEDFSSSPSSQHPPAIQSHPASLTEDED